MNRKCYLLIMFLWITTLECSTATPNHTTKRLRKKQVTSEVDSPGNFFSTMAPKHIQQPPPTIISPSVSMPFAQTNKSLRDQKNEQEILDALLVSIDFTEQGLITFFKQTFNNPQYKELLPYSFSHFVQCIRFGKRTEQPTDYYERIIRLFIQKTKVCPFITACAFERMITRTTPTLIDITQIHQKPLWESIKESIASSFSDYFSLLKSEPDEFFEFLGHTIADNELKKKCSEEKVKELLFRFFTTSIDKLVWTPHDQKETWNSFKIIGDHLFFLHEKKVIADVQDLNELYHGLIERFCYFLDLSGRALEPSVISEIKQDLLNHPMTWLSIPELEDTLETKVERLINALITVQLQQEAHGIEHLFR